MDTLFLKQARLLSNVDMHIVREDMKKIHWNNRLTAIRGARGIGKTTLMLQYIKQNYGLDSQEALYCTLDGLYFGTHTLLDLAEAFHMQGGTRLFLDEVHKYPNWSREIKEIHDLYPKLKIVISGSSLLNILQADADLSRRCIPYDMHGLSFREYILFYKNIALPVYKLEDLLENAAEICVEVNRKCRPVQLFHEYLQVGYYPFFNGDRADYHMQIENVVNLIVEQEMPLLCGIDPAYVRKLKALLEILASSVPYEVDISKLAGMIGLSRNTVLNYLQCLGRAGLLYLLYADLKSVKKMQKPDKIYLHNPNMLYAVSSSEVKSGTVREVFAVSQLSVGHVVEYGKKGDLRVDGRYTFEIGGADKSFKQVADVPDAYVLSDNLEYVIGRKWPLWSVGLLY